MVEVKIPGRVCEQAEIGFPINLLAYGFCLGSHLTSRSAFVSALCSGRGFVAMMLCASADAARQVIRGERMDVLQSIEIPVCLRKVDARLPPHNQPRPMLTPASGLSAVLLASNDANCCCFYRRSVG